MSARWPDFLIVGAPKCGTTSLYAYLRSHPQVFLPEMKEPDFFCLPEYDHARLGMKAVAADEKEYLALFEEAGDDVVAGEASTNYLLFPTVPGNIRARLGDSVRIVALLRDPVAVMHSLWSMFTRFGWEHRSAAKALLASRLDEPLTPETYGLGEGGFLYARRVHYAEQLKRYLDLFPAERVKILFFEEFFRPGLPAYPDLCRFLGVTDDHRPQAETHNEGYAVRSSRLVRFLNDQYPRFFYPLVRRLTPQGLRSGLKSRLLRFNKTAKASLDLQLRDELRRRLAPSVRELERLLGKDLSTLWF